MKANAITRRAGAAVGSMVLIAMAATPLLAADLGSKTPGCPLPVEQIEHIMQAEGTISNGVLDIELSRDDIGDVQTSVGVTLTPDFEINGDIFFQPLPGGKAFMNGDLAFKESEVNPVISVLLEQGLTWQAFHQHVPTEPQIWFLHFRGKGDPLTLARSIKAALNVTSTPFPQAPPKHPHTPLNADLLGKILHGDASVGGDGVVTVWILRKDQITIDGVRVNPQANISTNVEFQPLGGSRAAVIPDFSMTAEEVTPVVTLMRTKLGWYQGCLYNQEIDEHPQLFFDHMVKTGDAYELAHEIRQGLDLTDAE